MKRSSRGILIGIVIGNGHIRIRKDSKCNSLSATLVVKHSVKYKEYLQFKVLKLHSTLGGAKPKINFIDKSVIAYKTNKYFRFLKNKIYNNGNKKYTTQILNWLTAEGLALWWMDSGILRMKKRNGKIHAREGILNLYADCEQCLLVSDWFKKTHNICTIPVKYNGKYRLRFNTQNIKKLISLISPYMHESMMYKVHMKYNTTHECLVS